jgi:hypothetical protein
MFLVRTLVPWLWTGLFLRPRVRDGARQIQIVDHHDQLVRVVAVQDLDIEAGVGHVAGDPSELTRKRLTQTQDYDVANCEHAQPRCFEGPAGGVAIVKKKVAHALATYYERSAAFDAYSGAAKGFTHKG